jgi:hypothetical protein
VRGSPSFRKSIYRGLSLNLRYRRISALVEPSWRSWFGFADEFRDDALRQHLAEFDAPLVE